MFALQLLTAILMNNRSNSFGNAMENRLNGI